jgi:flagellar basal-body rod modification protein FlgD
MASPVSSIFGAAPSTPGTTTTTTTGTAPNEQMFLQLLVSQIQNQDPTNPVDGTQFVSQLAQFSELEQLIAIRGDLDGQATAASSNGNGTTNTNLPGSTSGPTAGGSTGTPPPSSTTNQN